jgi:hypothetical protein
MKKRLDLRIDESEFDDLSEYAELTGRNKTDIVREYLRTLRRKCDNLKAESEPS